MSPDRVIANAQRDGSGIGAQILRGARVGAALLVLALLQPLVLFEKKATVSIIWRLLCSMPDYEIGERETISEHLARKMLLEPLKVLEPGGLCLPCF